jgi:signal transduction histidine kinase
MLRLRVFDGQEKINEILLGAEVVTLGRDNTNHVMLPDLSVSRVHAQIEPTGNFYVIRDAGSTNGTFVNEILARVHVLTAGDTLRLGKFLLRVESMGSRSGDTTRVRVEELRLAEDAFELLLTTDAEAKKEPVTATTDSALALDSLRRLYELQRQLAHIDTTPALLERTLQLAVAELQSHSGGLLLAQNAPVEIETETDATQAAEQFHPAAVHFGGEEAGESPAGEEPPIPGTSIDEMVIPREIVAQVLMHKRGLAGQRPASGKKCPFLVCPLLEPRGVRGLLFVERAPESDPFSPLDLRFLHAIADQLVTSLANATLFEKVSQQSAKVETIVANLGDGVLVTDERQRVLEANTAALTLLGIHDHNPVGSSLFDLFESFQVSPEASVLAASAHAEGTFFHLRHRTSESDSTTARLISGRLSPFPKGADQPLGIVVTLRDRSREQHVEELKIEFLEKVAHKLRSPLTIIQGNVALLGSELENPAPTVCQILGDLERSTHHLAALVEEFVEFMELRTRTTPFVALPRETSIQPLVREVLRTASETEKGRAACLKERLSDDLPNLVTQPELLSRALAEVIDNAVKFGRDGGTVVVEAETTDSYLRLDVTDDGPGIPAERIDSVFYVCHQIDAEQTGQVPGAGLGLTIARQIIQEQGGEIEITGAVSDGGGTRVSLFLPLAETAQVTPTAGPARSFAAVSSMCDAGEAAPRGLEAELEKEETL